MPVSKVHYHIGFFIGIQNSDEFRDFPFLSDQELELIDDFVGDCLNGNALAGRNKRSWVDKAGNPIHGKELYQTCNVWHYHAGPHPANAAFTPNVRQENLQKLTSGPIIHYTWRGLSLDEVIILGFSPDHHINGFPDPKDKKNPLRSRSRQSGFYLSDQLIDPNE